MRWTTRAALALILFATAGLTVAQSPRWDRYYKEVDEMAGGYWQSTNGIWSSADSFTSGVPTSNDPAIFDGRSNHPVTSGLDQNLVNLGDFIVMEEYLGAIGGPGAPLDIDASRAVFRGGADIWVKDLAPFLSVIDRADLRHTMYLAGTAGNVFIKNGNVVALAGSTFDAIYGVHMWGNSKLWLEGEATTHPKWLLMFGGECWNYRQPGATDTIVVGPGAVLHQIGTISNTGSTLINAGGLILFEEGSDAAGTPGTQQWWFGLGSVDFSRCEGIYSSHGMSFFGPQVGMAGSAFQAYGDIAAILYDLRDTYPDH